RISTVYGALDLQTRTKLLLEQIFVATDGDEASDLPRCVEVEHAVQTLAGLRYPGLPVVRDTFAEGESIFLAIERVPGDDLAKQLKDNGKPFSVVQVLRWADQLLDALDYIHTLGPPLIHGDISPQYLKVQPNDQVMLLGFRVTRTAPLAEKAVAIDRP